MLTSRFFMYSIDGNDDASEIILGSLNSSFNIKEILTTIDGSKINCFFLPLNQLVMIY